MPPFDIIVNVGLTQVCPNKCHKYYLLKMHKSKYREIVPDEQFRWMLFGVLDVVKHESSRYMYVSMAICIQLVAIILMLMAVLTPHQSIIANTR